VDLALLGLLLALLAGPVIADLLRQMPAWGKETDPWLLIGLGSALFMAALICLPSAWNPRNTDQWRSLYTIIGIVTAALALFTWLVYGILGNWRTVAYVAPIVALLFGFVWNVGRLVGLSFERTPGHRAATLTTAIAPDAADLLATVHSLSAHTGGGATDGKVDLVWPERPGDPMLPTLRWMLRDFSGLRVAGVVPVDVAPVVVTAAEDQPLLKNRYSGADFPVLSTWRPRSFGSFNAILRWVLYREANTEPELQKVIVWVDRTQK
jgi:hypothetical protein